MIPVQHIHPMLVHFPIVLVLFLAGFDLLATARGKSVTGRTHSGNISSALAVGAGISAVATYYFGGLALDVAEAGGFSSGIAETHEGLGESVAIVLAIWALVRLVFWLRDIRLRGAVSYVFPLVAVASSVLVIVTAYYGGELVYDLGVNVAKVTAAL